MNSDRDEDLRDSIDDEPRSIFSALWFRVVLVVLVLGVVAAVALPFLLDVIAPSAPHTARKPLRQEARTMPAPAVAAPAAPALSVVTPAVATPEPPPPSAATPSPPAAPRSAVPAKPAPAATPPTRAAATPTPAPATRPAAQAPVVVGRVVEAPKADAPSRPAAEEPKRVAAAPKAAASAPKPAAATPKASAAKEAPGGYWVQVGAFRDPAAAKRVAESLRVQKFSVDESVKLAAAPAAPAPLSDADRYSVVVSGRSPDDIKRSLSAKSLRAEPASAGWTIVPAMPLADAVALSRDLAVDGLTVQVRRAGAAPAARPAADTNAEPLHRVRVGPYPDRPAAVAAVRQLEGAGYKPFIARGSE